MIKVRTQGPNGDPLIILGLSDMNIDRLRNKEPISFPLAELGLGAGYLAIVTGPDEAAIAQNLRAELSALGVDVSSIPGSA